MTDPIPPALIPWTLDVEFTGYPGQQGPGDPVEPVAQWDWVIYTGPDRRFGAVLAGMAEDRDPTPVLEAIVRRHNRAMDDYDLDRLAALEGDLAELVPIVLGLDHVSTEDGRILAHVVDDAETAGVPFANTLRARDTLAAFRAAASDAHRYADRIRDGQYSGVVDPAQSREWERLADYNTRTAAGETFPPAYVTRMRLAQLRFDAAQLERLIATHDWVICVEGGGYLCGAGEVPPEPADAEGDGATFVRVAGFNGNEAAVADALASGEHPALPS